MPNDIVFEPVLRKLGRFEALSGAEREAINNLPYRLRNLDAGAYIVREGDVAENCCALLSGFAFRHKVTSEGERQIVSIQIPGDFVDLQNSMLGIADHSVQALTTAEVAFVPREAIREITAKFPTVGRVLWLDTLVDASIFREWVLNVGRRNSRSRVAHLICEFGVRLADAGLASDHSYEMPMTQEQIGDCVGLTPVHVNRTLKSLERDGLIRRQRRSVQIIDWDRIQEIADFNPRYLHQDMLKPGMR